MHYDVRRNMQYTLPALIAIRCQWNVDNPARTLPVAATRSLGRADQRSWKSR